MSIQPFLIGGEWGQGNAAPIESVNPATGELNGYVGSASAADVDLAVTNALQAQRQPSWRNMLPHERARLLYRVAELIIERGPQLSAQQMRENGKLLSECSFQAAVGAGARLRSNPPLKSCIWTLLRPRRNKGSPSRIRAAWSD